MPLVELCLKTVTSPSLHYWTAVAGITVMATLHGVSKTSHFTANCLQSAPVKECRKNQLISGKDMDNIPSDGTFF